MEVCFRKGFIKTEYQNTITMRAIKLNLKQLF